MIVGSCNGLLCLHFQSLTYPTLEIKYWLRFWNPATRRRSKKLGLVCYSSPDPDAFDLYHSKLSFGYDA